MTEYKMIDLGLPSGLKWADRNVGAATPEEYGDYFMWGSTEPDTDKPCDWAHAPFNGCSSEFDKEHFNANKPEFLTDKGTLKPEYDAAHAIMGGRWRMPMSAEIRELIDGTTRSVKKMNGVMGMRFTSKTNGNSIFMPFAGYRYGSDVNNVGSCGYAWSSSLSATFASSSHFLDFRDKVAYCGSTYRFFGFVVRGVCA